MEEYVRRAADAFDNAENNLGSFPFSFVYEGKKYRGFGGLPLLETREEAADGRRTKYFDFDLDGIVRVTLKLGFWTGFGATEWTVFFENRSGTDSGVFESLCTRLEFEGALPMVDGIMGDHDNFYRPYTHDLTRAPLHFYNDSGRATHVTFPYFDLKAGRGGAMLAIGWAGTWRADFTFDGQKTVYEAETPARLHTFLKPGETIRSALSLLFPYPEREGNAAANLWRRWFIRCNMPKANAAGDPLRPFSTAFLAYDTGRHNTDGSISEAYDSWKPSMDKMIAEGLKADFRWFDAGWYAAPDGTSPDGSSWEKDWYATVGTWELDPKKWPGDSFRQSTDYARANGMKTLMWFEPERVSMVDALVKNHGYDPGWAKIQKDPGGRHRYANNIGDPACYRWTVDRIKKTLRENRVEMYREDNNIDAGAQWRGMDAEEGENREGITEMKLITAHYAMWDEILRCTESYGGCSFCDSCASGGGRNDLESMRRGVPLLRIDFDRTTTGMRLSMTTSFNRWIPFCGANTREQAGQVDMKGRTDQYVWRASYLPILNMSVQYLHDETIDFDVLRAGFEEWKSIREYLLGDFYVHTPWRAPADLSGFVAYSYVIGDGKRAVLFLFRQERCDEEVFRFTPPYIPAGESYTLRDADTGETVLRRGGEEISFSFSAPRTSKLLFLEKK